MNLLMAIDFTRSNGYHTDDTSLHHINPRTNQYIQTIETVGEILQYYNYSKWITVLGFGARM